MRSLLIIAFCISVILTNGQKPTTIYDTKIDKANKVEIKNGTINIKKADTVIISIIADAKSRVYLEGVKQVNDTSGLYITTISISNPHSQTLDLNIDLYFDTSVLEVTTKGMIGMIQTIKDDKNVWWTIVGQSLYSFNNNGGEIIVKSKTPVKLAIKGLLDILK